MTRLPLPHGLWPSPITPDHVATQSIRFGSLDCDGAHLYWTEARPSQGGRGTVMRAPLDGSCPPEEVLAVEHSARTRVHEYGGVAFLCDGAGGFYFIEDANQDIHHRTAAGTVVRITDAPGWRFADLCLDRQRNRLIAVAEVASPAANGAGSASPDAPPDGNSPHEHPTAAIVAVPLAPHRRHPTHLLGLATDQGETPATVADLVVLVADTDFFAFPRLSPDGGRLAWLSWSLPDMPWDAARLSLAEVAGDGRLEPPSQIAGGAGEAVTEPDWSPDGTLHYITDGPGSGRLMRWRDGHLPPLDTGPGDLFQPLWGLGARSYCLTGGDERVAFVTASHEGREHLVRAGPATPPRRIAGDLAGFSSLVALPGGDIAVIAASDRDTPAITVIRPNVRPHRVWPARSDLEALGDGISVGRSIEFHDDSGEPLHGVLYRPASDTHRAPRGNPLPPAIITLHGGPTGSLDRGFKPRVQFWTSRGFLLLDLAYSGTTGFGRDYRRRLDGAWGIRDVADTIAAARHLATAGLADPARIALYGGSAGGYTVLATLAASDLFAAGVSCYGIADLARLQATTHKFEAGYLYRLLGAKNDADPVFDERSPLHRVDRIRSPVLLLQGAEDNVVPPEQSQAMVGALRSRGVRADFHLFPGEGHGFRRRETIVAALQAELAFYREVMNLAPTT
ncbi:MAG: prolyl oligopeptidase family serine peptidase [Rhizobiales bacterium]|nr:prolyl oligopeptidase family serine peptidase [Hyphomicrobiales bacterium]